MADQGALAVLFLAEDGLLMARPKHNTDPRVGDGSGHIKGSCVFSTGVTTHSHVVLLDGDMQEVRRNDGTTFAFYGLNPNYNKFILVGINKEIPEKNLVIKSRIQAVVES